MLEQSLRPRRYDDPIPTPASLPADNSERRLAGLPEPELVLDLSRLISRLKFAAPTGVDRVEMAYAQQLLRLAPERLSFAAVHPSGVYGRLPLEGVRRFLDETAETWRQEGEAARGPGSLVRMATRLLSLMPRVLPPAIEPRGRPRVYLQVSPHHLDRPDLVGRILRRERARFVCLVHDLIPIEYPEHARPNGRDRHERRVQSVARYADAVIAASQATERSLLDYLGQQGRSVRVRVAPLGVEPVAPKPAPEVSGSPYFVAVGTIEPRKNHLLLLNMWRRMAEELGPRATPRLILIGRRGWENENIIDMLDRCEPLKGVVEERGHVSDQEMWSIVQGARALLMPSFAEGFGLPVIEALRLGTPVLCSNIAAHHEIAEPAAEFLDPLDGPAWRRAIIDYATPNSPRRLDQLRRMKNWRPPTWEAHVEAALELASEISA